MGKTLQLLSGNEALAPGACYTGARARELGNVRTLNIFMLGCFSVFAPLETAIWRESIRQRLPEKLVEINLAAFELGRKEIEGVRIG